MVTATPRDWENSERALELLTELDAVERESDFCSGQGWSDAARAHCDRAQEIEFELDQLRSEAVDAYAGTFGERESDPWWDATEEADGEATTVKAACDFARRQHFGDKILLGQAA